jgi:HSP20 family protein
MNLEKLKPWNWFKHEESDTGEGSQIPVSRSEAENLPLGGSRFPDEPAPRY